MFTSLSKIAISGPKESVTDVSHARNNHAILGKTTVNHSDRYVNIRMGLYQGFQTGLAGNDGDNVDFWNSPLMLCNCIQCKSSIQALFDVSNQSYI